MVGGAAPIEHSPSNEGEVNFRDLPNNTKSSWWLDPALRWNMMHCIGLCGTVFYSGYDGSLFNGLQSLDRWQEYFGHPDGNTLGLMNSAGFLPGIIAGFIGDRCGLYLGRRYTLWIGTLISAAGSILTTMSTSVAMFCGGRAVTGFGYSIALAVAPALLQEIAHPRYRGQIGSFYTCVYFLSSIISAAACLGCLKLQGETSWRIPCWLQLIGPCLTLILTANIPESPRWLVKNDRPEQAFEILARFHANGKKDDPLVLLEFREIQKALSEEASNNQTRYSDLVKGPGNRQRTAITVIVAFGTNWVGNGIISYYLSPTLKSLGIGSTETQLQILLGLQCWNLVISSTAAVLVDRVGRRPLWLSSTTGMLISLSVVMGLSASYSQSGNTAVGAAAIPFLFLFYGSYDIAWTPLTYSYPSEIFPYSLRTKAMAVFLAMQTSTNSVNTWLNPIALDAIAWKYYGVYIAIDFVLVIVIYFLFPETKGLTIEEIQSIFDKDQPRHLVSSVSTDNVDKDAGDSKPPRGAHASTHHVEKINV